MQKAAFLIKVELWNKILPPIFRNTLVRRGAGFGLGPLLSRVQFQTSLILLGPRRDITHRRNYDSLRHDIETPNFRNTLLLTLHAMTKATQTTTSSPRTNGQIAIIPNGKLKPSPANNTSGNKPVALNGPNGGYVLASFATVGVAVR